MQKEFLKQIYEKYNFDKDADIFMLELGGRKIPIITKLGMQKIMKQEEFLYEFKPILVNQDYASLECKVFNRDGEIMGTSFGSAEATNVRNKAKYYLEMAEKRAKVRAVLIAIDAHGIVYSEEEADEFKQ